ncbi:MAG: DUF4139 domain-containing protein [Desulfotignum sp.]
MRPLITALLPLILFIPVFTLPAGAQIDLEVLTEKRSLQAFIYHSADLTLIRETRTLHFTDGSNLVRFSWAGTRIDPTSLALEIKDPALPVKIAQMRFPAGTNNQVVWQVQADDACRADVEITYFTSGIFWQPRYTAFLSQDRSRMHLTGHVRVENRSGLDYPDVKVSLVVGRIRLLDRIAELADRPFPYGRPDTQLPETGRQELFAQGKAVLESAPVMEMAQSMDAAAPRQIEKTRTSEYFVYAIDGTETLADNWARQLLFVDAPDVPVDTIHVFDQDRFGDTVIQMMSFANDTASGLGSVPLPSGGFTVFQKADTAGGLLFAGTDASDYIPQGNENRLNLGSDPRITVIPRVMAFEKKNLTFDKQKNLSGFDDIRQMAIELANFSDQPARIEIFGSAPDPDFTITRISGQDGFEKIDQTRFKFFASLSSGSRKTIHYTIISYKGDRKWQRPPVPAS